MTFSYKKEYRRDIFGNILASDQYLMVPDIAAIHFLRDRLQWLTAMPVEILSGSYLQAGSPFKENINDYHYLIVNKHWIIDPNEIIGYYEIEVRMEDADREVRSLVLNQVNTGRPTYNVEEP